MILYFSGTGNRRYVAQVLSQRLHEDGYSMEDNHPLRPLEDNETLGIVFPVYAWGVPRIVRTFLRHMTLSSRYVWTVMTCGDDMGHADSILEKTLRRKVDAAFSVGMPNTYVCLPGFETDSPALAQQKVEHTQRQLPLIAASIGQRLRLRQLTRGSHAWAKTYLLRPLFQALLLTDRYFWVHGRCNACGLCAAKCPTHDITCTDGHPTWGPSHCTGCLRCFHSCPRRAIEWGRFTQEKQQKGQFSPRTAAGVHC